MTDRAKFKKELIEYIQSSFDQDVIEGRRADLITITEDMIFNSPPSFKLTTAGNKFMTALFDSHTVDIKNIGLSRAIVDIDRCATGPFYIQRGLQGVLRGRGGRSTMNNRVTLYGGDEVVFTKLSDDISFWLEQKS